MVCAAGQVIFEQGDIGSEFYFILSGELEVAQHGASPGTQLNMPA